jgi:hypothetical protein
MKYKDRGTINSWNKQIDKLDQPDSDRKRRRERERELKKFSEAICLVVGKDWWDCVTLKQKEALYSNWSSVKYRNFYSLSFSISFEEWLMSIKDTVIIDKGLYREKKINKVLDEF